MAVMNFGGVDENVVTREEFPLEKAREVLKDEVIAVIGYGVRCDRTLLAGCADDLDYVSGIFAAGRALALCQADTLTDDLALFIDTAAELRLRSRDDGVRNLVLMLLIQLASPCQLCYLVQYVVFDA